MGLKSKPVINIGINGAGRIGMGFFKQNLFNPPKNGQEFRVVAINDVQPIQNIANTIPLDSIHKHDEIKMRVVEKQDGGEVFYTGNRSQEGKLIVLNQKDPSNIPWGSLGVDIVIDATGQNRTISKASMHIGPGKAKKVVVTAPSSDIPMIVMGYNHGEYNPALPVVSGASCTTNCVVPPLAVLNEQFGVEWAYILTVHAVTGDQRIVGGPHKDSRRGQSMFSISPTETGAAKATGKIIPALKDKIDGAAICYRVPVAVGSIVDLTATLKNPPASAAEINGFLKAASTNGSTMSFSMAPLVSELIVGNRSSGIVDGQLTQLYGDKAHVRIWYDNEMGYIHQLIRLVNHIVEQN